MGKKWKENSNFSLCVHHFQLPNISINGKSQEEHWNAKPSLMARWEGYGCFFSSTIHVWCEWVIFFHVLWVQLMSPSFHFPFYFIPFSQRELLPWISTCIHLVYFSYFNYKYIHLLKIEYFTFLKKWHVTLSFCNLIFFKAVFSYLSWCL